MSRQELILASALRDLRKAYWAAVGEGLVDPIVSLLDLDDEVGEEVYQAALKENLAGGLRKRTYPKIPARVAIDVASRDVVLADFAAHPHLAELARLKQPGVFTVMIVCGGATFWEFPVGEKSGSAPAAGGDE